MHIKDLWLGEKAFQGRKSAQSGEFAVGTPQEGRKAERGEAAEADPSSGTAMGAPPAPPAFLRRSLPPSLPALGPEPILRQGQAAPEPGAASLHGLLCT